MTLEERIKEILKELVGFPPDNVPRWVNFDNAIPAILAAVRERYVLLDDDQTLPGNPYPEDVFTMNNERYVKAVPDPALRTAISGFLMREGFLLALSVVEHGGWDAGDNGDGTVSVWKRVRYSLRIKEVK